jgi:ferric-dicitrate binding protein FerR (iron transport regulator)
LRERIAAEQTLASRAGSAGDASQRSAEAHDVRMEYERRLAALRRPARRRLVIAIAVAAVLAIGAWLAPRFQQPASGPQVAQQISGEPLRLKLDKSLKTDR